MIGLMLVLLFAAAQGGVVVVTAFALSDLFGPRTALTKIASVCLSYAGWVGVTIGGYALLVGEGGLMDGFGLLLFLCFTALVSSALYLVGWLLAGLRRRG